MQEHKQEEKQMVVKQAASAEGGADLKHLRYSLPLYRVLVRVVPFPWSGESSKFLIFGFCDMILIC